MGANMGPNMSREAFGGCPFSMSFGLAKSWPKLYQNGGIWRPKTNFAMIFGGLASRAAVLGGVSRVV